MSNYAPDPSKELIYGNLQHKTLSSLTASEVQTLTDPTFIQPDNQDALITYNLINRAAFRDDSGVIPGSSICVKATVTDTNSVVAFTPAKGEVWQVMACSSEGSSAPSTSLTYYLYLKHGVLGTGPPEDEIEIYVGAVSSGSTTVSLSGLLADIGGNGPFLIDEYASIVFDVSAMQGVTRFDIYTYMARIR